MLDVLGVASVALGFPNRRAGVAGSAMSAVPEPFTGPTGRDQWDIQVDTSAALSRVPDGVYVARYIESETLFLFNSGKVILRFEIVEGDLTGTRLVKPYRVKKLLSRPRKGGRFTLGRSSELLRDLVRLTAAKVRPDRLSLEVLRRQLWRIRTRTVDRDYKQREIPDVLRYSVVAEIVEAETT
ncbi:MAG: hypothetical protein ROZ64_15845 [Burkholderiaceae bacterium]|nr:hypothetical protein [Burkholderiaceae bacterium]